MAHHTPVKDTSVLSSSSETIMQNPWSEESLCQVIQAWKLTSEETRRLRIVGEKLKDLHHHPWVNPDVVLGYMLRSGGFQHAEVNVRKTIHWRTQHQVDNLLKSYQPNPVLLDYTPLAFLQGCDKDGDPIYCERGGAIDALGMLKRFSREELDRYAIWLREVQSHGDWVKDFQNKSSKKITKVTVIYDLKGLSSRHLNPKVLGWFKQYMELTGLYYPAPIKRVIIIRAPAVFRGIWKAVKHCFSAECREKMIFAGPKDHLEILSKYMDLDVLPPCINPEGRGTTAIGMPPSLEGGKIPDHVGAGGSGYVRTAHARPRLGSKEISETSAGTVSGAEDEQERDDQVDTPVAASSHQPAPKGKRMHLKFLRGTTSSSEKR